MAGKRRICDMGENKNINILIAVSEEVFQKLGIDTHNRYLMDVKRAIFRLYDLDDPDLSITSPKKTLAEQHPNNAYGVPINDYEMCKLMELFDLDENDYFQESIGGRIVREILNSSIDKLEMKFIKKQC